MVTMLTFSEDDMVKSGTEALCFRGICYLCQQARLIIMMEEDETCEFFFFFNVLLTVHLSIILDNDQLDTHLLYFKMHLL